jgi:hypothetical protein
MPGVQIHGTGTITGGYWNKSYYEKLFDTTLNVLGIKGGVYSVVSTSWFGAAASNVDNTRYFQKAIDATINKNMTSHTPSGLYNDSSSVTVQDYIGNNSYSVCSLVWRGDYVMNGATAATVINYKGTSGYCIGIEYGKGVEIHGLNINGRWVAPSSSNLRTYYNTTFNNFTDANGVCTAYYSGIVVDPAYPNSSSGSTAIVIKNCYIGNFSNCINISPANVTLNAEMITIERCSFGDCRLCVVGSEAQEKMNIVKNCMAWGSSFAFFSDGNQFRGQAGFYHITENNIAGRVINFLYVTTQGWFNTVIDHNYCEGIGSIGTISTFASGQTGSQGMGIEIYACTFQLVDTATSGLTSICTTNSTSIMFRGCNFTYYDGTFNKVFPFTGKASFDNCNFMGIYSNSVFGSVFYPSCRFTN